MQYLLDGTEAGNLDKISIQKYGIPSLVLMERAALALSKHVAEFLETGSFHEKNAKILVVCGMGNNGGDGVAAGRILQEWGYDVSIFLLGNREKASVEMKTQLDIAEKCSMNFIKEPELEKYPVLIDAVFGIGLSREVTGEYAAWIQKINQCSSYVFSVDIPSGISADTGAVLGTAVKADKTVTFGTGKLGLFLSPGYQYAGEVFIEEIGFPAVALKETAPNVFFYTKNDLDELFPKRKQDSHKGSYGKLLVIAGSENISGAAYFTAKAAYLLGCGLVKVVTHRNNRSMIQEKLPEALHTFYDEDEYDLTEDIHWASAIVIGPGLGKNFMAEKLLSQVLTVREKPVLIDADGLNLLAGKEEYVKNDEILLPGNFVLTPHLVEMSRLTDALPERLKEAPLEYVKRTKNGAVIVMKDSRTFVSDGTQVYVNLSGNHALAKGGSGDVLSGIIGGLLARGMKNFLAATLGVYLHGLTAEEYIKKRSSSSMLASDILEMLPEILP